MTEAAATASQSPAACFGDFLPGEEEKGGRRDRYLLVLVAANASCEEEWCEGNELRASELDDMSPAILDTAR